MAVTFAVHALSGADAASSACTAVASSTGVYVAEAVALCERAKAARGDEWEAQEAGRERKGQCRDGRLAAHGRECALQHADGVSEGVFLGTHATEHACAQAAM